MQVDRLCSCGSLLLWFNHFSSNFNKFQIFFWFFTETLTLSLPFPRRGGDNTHPPSDSNNSKTVRVNIAFTGTFFKKYSISFLMICRLIDFALVVLKLLMLKVCAIIGISKIGFFNFSGKERVNMIWSTVVPYPSRHLPVQT